MCPRAELPCRHSCRIIMLMEHPAGTLGMGPTDQPGNWELLAYSRERRRLKMAVNIHRFTWALIRATYFKAKESSWSMVGHLAN